MRREDGAIDRWDALVWGLGLIVLGVVFLLHYLGMLEWGLWHSGWPLLVIFLGAMRLFTARSPRRLGGAVTTLGIGGWFLLAANGWYGLEWGNSWPLALVAIGVGFVVRSLAAFVMRRDEPDREGRVDARS